MGRRTKRSDEREAALMSSLRLGNTRRAAAAFAGISHDTFYQWMKEQTFADAVSKAEADAEARFLAQVAKAAADGTWTAAAWWLERRRPDDYGRKERVDSTSKVEITGKDGGPIETLAGLSDHERRALKDAIEEHLASEPAPSA